MANVRADRVYQDFEPATTWISEPHMEILVADLPGFKKEQIKVQVTSTKKLRLSGERPAGGNKWIRFRQEIPLPPNFDVDSISARFIGGKLYVEHPKDEPKEPETKPPTPPEKPVARAGDQPETREDDRSKPMVEDKRPGAEQSNGGKTELAKPDAEKEAKEAKDAKGESTEKTPDQDEPKGPMIPKEEGKEKVGAKGLVKYKEASARMAKEAKNKRLMLCNLVAVVLMILLILLYARNAVWSSFMGKSEE